MSQYLTASIVRVLGSKGDAAGTGFLVTDDGLIATCAHVVQAAGAGPGDTVRLVFHATGDESEALMEPAWWRDPDAEEGAILAAEWRATSASTVLSHTVSQRRHPHHQP